MIPDLDFDPEPILQALDRHEVDYVLIGGLAAQLHGARIPRTRDIDITPSRDRENLERLASALRELGAKLRPPGLDEGFAVELDERTFARMVSVSLTTRYGPVDVSLLPDGTGGYEDLSVAAVLIERWGVRVRIASLADIIRSKEAAGRNKDLEHLPLLLERLSELQGHGFEEDG